MRIHIIACRVFTRELSYYAAVSPQTVDITWLPQGLHDTPDRLRTMVQSALDDLYRQLDAKLLKHRPDIIVLGYGLCSGGLLGIRSGEIPLLVPRTDDCIAQFLGSQERYLELFWAHSGTYWLNNGWIESAFLPLKEQLAARREEYIRLYGEDNADFLLEQEGQWAKNYTCCAYIRSPVHADPAHPAIARRLAEENALEYREYPGSSRMLELLTTGTWNDREFCLCPPHHQLAAAYDGSIFRAVPV